MKRGDLILIALQGDFGKPRPALIIQSDLFNQHTSITVLPITSTLIDAPLLRISLEPNIKNGLQKPSQIMIDKAVTIKKDKVTVILGQIEQHTLTHVERSLAVFLGIV